MAAEAILIIGESGSGKSTSMRNLNPEETFVISVCEKSLPFKGWKSKYTKLRKEDGKWVGNYYVQSDYKKIIQALQIVNAMPHIKQVIVDDLQYMMSYEFVERATETGYGKFSELAQHVMEVIRYSEKMRSNCKLIFLTHSENVGDTITPKYAMKTIGKLLSEKVTLEGMFTYVFFTKMELDESGKMQYKFITNNDGECVAKTPMGMFEDLLIDNDLVEIIKVMDEYNAE